MRDTIRGMILLAGLAGMLTLSGCMVAAAGQAQVPHSDSSSAWQSKQEESKTDGSRVDTEREEENDPEKVETEEEQTEPVKQAYDFSQPVPESPAVENDYFQDAAFIGDSRTDGFMIYSGIGCGENLTSNGLSIFTLQKKKAITIDGEEYTLLDALAKKQYGKVYISLGVNELGYANDKGFYEAYCQAIDIIRASQPNAVIYIQGLIPLNEDVIAATGGAKYLTNEHLLVYNDLMKQVAEEKRVAFLDLNPQFSGPDGQLPEDASGDGIHLRASYCKQWLEYLKTHTVSYEELYG